MTRLAGARAREVDEGRGDGEREIRRPSRAGGLLEHTIQVRNLLAAQKNKEGEPWSPSYLNKHVVALRQVLEQAWQLGLMTAEDRDRAKKLPTSKGTRLPAGQHLPIERVGALLAECEIVNRPPGQSGFVVLARRWIVERMLSWVMRARRTCRDYERLPAHSEAHITWAAITLMSRRLAWSPAIGR